jgi:outer membrane protein assembly factor BamB
MVIGYRVETTTYDSELERMLDNLRFMCTDSGGFNEQKYNCYKEKLLRKYSSDNSNDDLVIEQEHEESKIPVLSPSATIVGGPKNTPWPMQSHDLHHTGRSPYSTDNVDGLEKWRFYTDDWFGESPIIDSDGTIYAGAGRELYAINPDGSLKWMYQTGGQIIGSSPAISEDGTIYIGAWDGYLHAINSDGTKKWKCPANGANIASSPAIADDGTIYFGTMWSLGDGGKIHAVNPDGTEKWYYQTGDAVTSDPAIGDDGTVYIGSCDNYLYALWPNGTLRWRFKTKDWIQGHPSIADDDTIYIGSFDDNLYALYPNGTMKWKCGVGPGTETNPSLADDGTIYVGSNRLYAIYPNGTRKWAFNPGSERFIAHSSPAVSAEGAIYFGTNIGETSGGEIIAVNPNGTERWRKRIADEWVDSSPSIAEDGTVYVGSSSMNSDSYIHAFGPIESNEPPGTPTISGETNGWVGESYWYTFKSIDPDRNPISFYIDWGDGEEGWTSERASGEKCYYDHAWSERDEYTIRCKAKDVMGEESDWATFEVKIGRKSREVQQMLFYRLLEQFLILQKILKLIK